jgi:hypothetical protein
VILTSYSVPVRGPSQVPAEIANYVSSRTPRGLVVHECECQAHCWALPWDDAMDRWVSHQISPIRSMLEEKGFKPEKPSPSQHVVLISHEDVCDGLCNQVRAG